MQHLLITLYYLGNILEKYQTHFEETSWKYYAALNFAKMCCCKTTEQSKRANVIEHCKHDKLMVDALDQDWIMSQLQNEPL